MISKIDFINCKYLQFYRSEIAMLKKLWKRFWKNKNFKIGRPNILDNPNRHLNDFGSMCAFPDPNSWVPQNLLGNHTLMGAFCVIAEMGKLLRNLLDIDQAGGERYHDASEREIIKLILIEHLKSMRQTEEIYFQKPINREEMISEFRIIIDDER